MEKKHTKWQRTQTLWLTILRTMIFTISLFLIINIQSVTAQNKSEIQQFENIFDTKDQHDHYTYAKTGNDNEIQFVLSGLFLIYKEFISSQDGNSCAFYPSCSTYALLAIKRQGLFIGTFNAFDRLARCNPLSPEQYTIYDKYGLLYDPEP